MAEATGIDAWKTVTFTNPPVGKTTYDIDELKPSTSGKAARFMRWSELEKFPMFDLAQNDPISAGGLPIYNDGRFVYLETSENHNLIIGPTGGGKSEAIVRPMLKSGKAAGESFVIFDCKGELARKEYRMFAADPRFNVKVLNLREQNRGNRWNMDALAEYYYKRGDINKERMLCRQNAQALAPKSEKEPYWELSAVGVNAGMNILHIEDPTRTEPASMVSAYHKLKENAGSVEDGKEYEQVLRNNNVDPCVLSQISHVTHNAENTARCVWSTVTSAIDPFEFSPAGIDQLMTDNEIDITSFSGEKPVVLFIILPDDTSMMAPVASMLVNQIYSYLCDFCSTRIDGKLPIRTNFIIDEAGILKVSELAAKLSASRSRNIRFSIIVQSSEQLESLYGEKDAFNIIANCQNKVWLGGYSKIEDEFIELAGEDLKGKPLLTKYDLTHLKKGEEALFFLGDNPVLAGKIRGMYACKYYCEWAEDYIPENREIHLSGISAPQSKEVSPRGEQKLSPKGIGNDSPAKDDANVTYVIGPQFSIRDADYLRKAFLSLIHNPLMRLLKEDTINIHKISHICEFCYMMKHPMPMDEFGEVLKKSCREGESIYLISLLVGPDPMGLRQVSENLMHDFEDFFDLED